MLCEEEDGTPLIDHLLAVERQTGQTPQILLDAPDCPDGCEELWGIFLELHSCRGQGRITYQDIDAFQRVTNTALKPWERAAIKAADDCYLRRQAEQNSNPNP